MQWRVVQELVVGLRRLPLNRPGFPGECFICELRLPDHRFRWKHNKLFLLLPG
ncbi:diguanylate cyclase, partial [Escherichia coli]|nr:diguanylate cyclase [Escherichia coli]EEQ3916191.1 diguanylate cyclase [Escherichia coli]EEQ7824199.1 diguanylate cyclase [Escherichia coli]EEQ8570059.1 diguanylate cyclase [Escherichia coli]EER3212532.1 diguanylate cyclase [Escherichia coli]